MVASRPAILPRESYKVRAHHFNQHEFIRIANDTLIIPNDFVLIRFHQGGEPTARSPTGFKATLGEPRHTSPRRP